MLIASIRLSNLFAPNRSFKRGHHFVYVTELSKDVLHEARFVRANPNFQTGSWFEEIDKT
jgi:hypothetical protein